MIIHNIENQVSQLAASSSIAGETACSQVLDAQRVAEDQDDLDQVVNESFQERATRKYPGGLSFVRSEKVWADLRAEQAAAAAPDPSRPAHTSAFNLHECKRANIIGDSRVIICSLCGSYGWNSARGLMGKCVGGPPIGVKKAQFDRFAVGNFPGQHKSHLKLGKAGPLQVGDLDWLASKAIRKLGSMPVVPSFLGSKSCSPKVFDGVSSIQRLDTLGCYGLTESSLLTWIAKLSKKGSLSSSVEEHFVLLSEVQLGSIHGTFVSDSGEGLVLEDWHTDF